MGNSCNKVHPSGCSAPIICSAHISCSVPIWCGSSNCADPRVQLVEEPQPLPGPASPEPIDKTEPDTSRRDAADGSDAAPGTPEATSANQQQLGDTDNPANGTDATSDEPDTNTRKAPEAVDSFARVAALADDLETGEPVADVESPGPGPRQSVEYKREADESEDEAAEDLPLYNFNIDALPAMEQFGLLDASSTLVTHSAGRPMVQYIQSLCVYATNAGAATYNCKRFLAQVKRVADYLARALEAGGVRKIVRQVLSELHPVLESAEAVFRSWEHKGSLEKFFSGHSADDEFLRLHVKLRDCCLVPAFAQLVQKVPLSPPPPPTAEADGGDEAAADGSFPPPDAAPSAPASSAVEEPSGYTSVEASKVAFERLLLLFILRYKPNKKRSQRQRLVDLLHEYSCSSDSLDDKLENLCKNRLDRTPKDVLPLLREMMSNMWGATDIPKVRIEKWRLAVRLALEPLMVATGEWQLPQVPEEGTEPFCEE